MKLQDALGIPRGITSVIGGGGKTTLLSVLARELAAGGVAVALTTSTHFLPFEGMPALSGPDEWDAAASPVACFASPTEEGKLAAPACGIPALAAAADYVLVEADGSKRLPLKAHAAWEPVIPAGTVNVVWVVGASGLGKPVSETAHRPELFCERCGCMPTDIATPERVAQALNAELRMLNLSTARIMLNQVDTLSDPTTADRFQAALSHPIIATSLK